MSNFETVATLAELPEGGRLSVVFDDRAVLLFRIGETVYAIEDVCSHDQQPLTDGAVVGTTIECPRHAARFDLCTGKPLCMPAIESIATFEVRLQGNEIQLATK